MDFTLPQDIDDIARRTAQFVDEEILPLEADSDNYDAHENISLELLAQMRDRQRQKVYGLLRHLSIEAGWVCRSWVGRRCMNRPTARFSAL